MWDYPGQGDVCLCAQQGPEASLTPIKALRGLLHFPKKGRTILGCEKSEGKGIYRLKTKTDFTERFVASCISHTDCRDLLEKTHTEKATKKERTNQNTPPELPAEGKD